MSPPVRKFLFFPILFFVALIPLEQVRAAFHLWTISQVYSNGDGSIQFVELFVCCSGENFIGGFDVVTYRDAEQDEQRFTFPSGIPAEENTAGRHLLLATGPISGVEPDFVIPQNFVPIAFSANATVDISWAFQGNPNIVTYGSIPTDGFRSIDGFGNVKDPATVTNFSGDTATVIPAEPPEPPEVPEITALSFSEGTFSLSFSTENGRTYTIEYLNALGSGDWEVLAVVEGTGNVESVSDPNAEGPRRFYRVRAE